MLPNRKRYTEAIRCVRDTLTKHGYTWDEVFYGGRRSVAITIYRDGELFGCWNIRCNKQGEVTKFGSNQAQDESFYSLWHELMPFVLGGRDA